MNKYISLSLNSKNILMKNDFHLLIKQIKILRMSKNKTEKLYKTWGLKVLCNMLKLL
jgi:hypothetical protein